MALTCVEYPKIPVPHFAFKKVYGNLKDVVQDEFEISKLNLDETKENYIKEKLSFTNHINLYDNCPRLYKLVHEYKFPEVKTKELIFGELVHISLEELNKIKFENKSINIQEIKEKYMDFYKYLYKKYNIKLENFILEEGFTKVLDYYKNYMKNLGIIKDVEKKVMLTEKEYIIEGIVDLVVEKNGHLEIVDFKTGKNSGYKKEYEEQIQIYAYLLEKKYSKEILVGKIFYINEEKEKKIIYVNLDNEAILKTINKFKKIATEIVRKNYKTGYLDKDLCKYCDFRSYCKNYLDINNEDK